jgi:starch synthase
MKVIYTAPNRAHHYRYASSLNKANILLVFVSGFSRLSPRAKLVEIKERLYRADILQSLYLISLKVRLPKMFCSHLAYLAKIEQDFACIKFLKDADLFLFYNGGGLSSCRKAKKKGVITVVEAVNSHVEYQEDLLKEEYEKLNLKWTPFHQSEKRRRLKEYDEADYILLPSEFVKRSFIEKGFPEKKLIKVPFGFDNLNKTEIKDVIDGDAGFTVLFVGSISVRKGLRYLIEAFKMLELANKKLIIVGPRDAVSGIDDIELTEDIIFRGVLKGSDLANEYSLADVFCLPTLEEGMALVQGEALSFGLPIITTTNSGGDELVTDGLEGFIVPIRDAAAIHQKLMVLGSDKKLLYKMKLAAQKKAATLNGWDASGILLCQKFETLFLNRKSN